jgi:hypothetical protein
VGGTSATRTLPGRRRANACGPVGDHRTPAPAGPGVRVAALVQRGRRGPGLPPGASAAVRLSDRHCVCNEQDTKHPVRPSGTTLLYHAGTPRIYIFRRLVPSAHHVMHSESGPDRADSPPHRAPDQVEGTEEGGAKHGDLVDHQHFAARQRSQASLVFFGISASGMWRHGMHWQRCIMVRCIYTAA